MSLDKNVKHTLGRYGSHRKAEKAYKIAEELERLTRESDEVKGRIPLWDRIVFFSDTPDEERNKKLKKTIALTQAALQKHQKRLTADLQQICDEIPPLEIGQRIEICIRLTLRPLKLRGLRVENGVTRKEISSALRSLARRVTELYLPDPDFDHQALIEVLATDKSIAQWSDPDRARIEDHYYLGVAPITFDSLKRVIATCMSDRELPLTRARRQLENQDRLVMSLLSTLGHESTKVRLADKLNPFRDSRTEKKRNRTQRKLQTATHELARRQEKFFHLQEKALEIYPPMQIYQAIGQALAVLDILDTSSETNLSAEGKIVTYKVASGRALLLAAMQELRQAFRDTFPNVPLPSEIGRTQAQSKKSASAAESPREQMLTEINNILEKEGASAEQERALNHAYTLGSIQRHLNRAHSEISAMDRVSFWSTTGAEERELRMQHRDTFRRTALQTSWKKMRKLSHKAGVQLPPMHLRDLTIKAIEQLAEVRTETKSSRSQHKCPVFGRQALNTTMNKIAKIFNTEFKLRGNRRRLMANVATSLKERTYEEVPEMHMFRVSTHHGVIARIASELSQTDFLERYQRVRSGEARGKAASAEKKDLDSRISAWDRINVFSMTPDEQRFRQLWEEVNSLELQVKEDMLHVDALMEKALRAYPPARLYFALGGVKHTIQSIKTKSRRKKVNGVREYTCVLVGKNQAVEALRNWSISLIEVFGLLPTTPELLDIWAGHELRQPEATWLDWDPEERGFPKSPWKPKS